MKDRYDVILILAILIIDHSKDYEYFCYKHKVSKNIKNRFINIFKNFEYLKSKKFYSKDNIKKQIYFTNKEYVKDLILFSLFINNKIEIVDVKKLIDFVNVYEIPKFPISGEYLKMYGYEPGEALGKKLKSLEEEWIKNNFFLDKKFLEKSLEKK
jgi:poly(A) polymerase